jgi:AcrR family transcriptional regulator
MVMPSSPHGIDGLSVRRVASELDVWPTTIYYHVGGTKDGLLALTLDAIAGELELPAPGDGPWPEAVEEIAGRLRAGSPGMSSVTKGTTASRISRYAELGARDDLPLTALLARALPADDDERSAAASASSSPASPRPASRSRSARPTRPGR